MTCYVLTGSCPRSEAQLREEMAEEKEAQGKPLEAEWYRMTVRQMRREGLDVDSPRAGLDGPGFMCDRGTRRDHQAVCPCGHLAEYLCDAPIGRGRTCDKPLCRCCRIEIGPDLDHCGHHQQLVAAL